MKAKCAILDKKITCLDINVVIAGRGKGFMLLGILRSGDIEGHLNCGMRGREREQLANK